MALRKFMASSAARSTRPAVRASWFWVVLLWLSLVAAGCGKPAPRLPPLPPQAVVVVLGDSLAAGYGLPASAAWPALLAAESGWQVINAGVSGDTSAQGLARLGALLDAHSPAAVLILLGGNDMLRQLPERDTRANLLAAIEQARSAGAQPLLLAVPRPSLAGAALRSLDDAEFYGEIAERAGVPLIAGVFAAVLADPENKLDRLHPNAAGQREIVRRMVPILRDSGLLAR
jgi:acyl-CoA thioesterase-1